MDKQFKSGRSSTTMKGNNRKYIKGFMFEQIRGRFKILKPTSEVVTLEVMTMDENDVPIAGLVSKVRFRQVHLNDKENNLLKQNAKAMLSSGGSCRTNDNLSQGDMSVSGMRENGAK